MKLAQFFITRPIFAVVLSMLIVTGGGLAFFRLPLTEYPQVTPTTVVVRVTRMAALPASQTLIYQLAVGAAWLLLASFLFGQTEFRMTPLVWASLAFQSVFVSFLSYLVWFWLLRKYLASRLGVFSFLTPLFGLVLGAWLLGEPVGAGFLGGTLLVVSGVVLLSGYGWYCQWRAQRTWGADRG